MRVALCVALFLFSSVTAGEGTTQKLFDSLDVGPAQIDQNYNLQPCDAEDLDEDAHINRPGSPIHGFTANSSGSPLHCDAFGYTRHSPIRAPPVYLTE